MQTISNETLQNLPFPSRTILYFLLLLTLVAIDAPISVAQESESKDQAKQLYKQARSHWKNHRYDKAFNVLENARSKASSTKLQDKISEKEEQWQQSQKLFELWFEKAKKAQNEKNWMKVIKHAENALEHLPEHPEGTSLLEKANHEITEGKMVKVPEGTYTIGDDEIPGNPRRDVHVDGFLIDKTQVTRSEYKQFLNDTEHTAPAHWPSNQAFGKKSDHPVTGIRFEDARAYADWIGKRLPTEMEYEIASRGPESFKYPWGNKKKNLQNLVNVRETSGNDTVSVSSNSRGKSPFGLFHAIGNAGNWTRTTVKIAREQSPLKFYVVKGGSYFYPLDKSRPANRVLHKPGVRVRGVGFRCAKDLEEENE